ncbi:cadherin-1-like isoform 2-T2 [Anomaloglossus baeobatrachus]|uniref:cadherin-1-like isoform X2 n=1 Tax=Anomaloglossus baeobatrachus TaxID=238106 RepID=UPI003F5088A7
MRLSHLAFLILLGKVSLVVSGDLEQCVPGFSEERYAFTVPRRILERGRAVGKVTFTSCSVNNRALYSPEDTRFRVFPDGKVTVKRSITLHDGYVSFVLNAWDADGKRHSVPIFLWNEREQQAQTSAGNKDIEKTSPLLRRKKRAWIIPPILLFENGRGPFPKLLVQVTTFSISESGQTLEGPMEIVIKVVDQNDNKPVFTQEYYDGGVKEDALPGTAVVKVSATDADESETANGIVGYSITDQTPGVPNSEMFRIDPESGLISLDKPGLSYEDMSGGSDSLLSTHVLNTAQGIPAKGLAITLSKLDAGQTKWTQVSRSVTNEDGRCPGLLRGEPLTAGTFQLRFDTKDYWRQMQQDSFYPYVEVVFTISDPKQKHHVPLLLTPYSYTTYRGS